MVLDLHRSQRLRLSGASVGASFDGHVLAVTAATCCHPFPWLEGSDHVDGQAAGRVARNVSFRSHPCHPVQVTKADAAIRM